MLTEKTYQGSVTVFLALVFTLMVSLILVSLEAARAAVLRGCAMTALATATESAMADFYRPLFDKYGIYALDLGYGDSRANTHRLQRNIETIAEINIGDYSLKGSSLNGTTTILSENGEYFITQVLDAERTAKVSELITALGEKIGLFTEQEESTAILTRKTEIENRLAQIDVYTLQLMENLDGIAFDLEAAVNGNRIYNVNPAFVKRLFVLPVNSANVGINNSKIYEQVKYIYTNPVERINALVPEVIQYAELVRERELLLERLLELYAEFERAPEEDKLQISEAISPVAERYYECTSRILEIGNRCEAETKALNALCTESLNGIGNSLKIIEDAKGLRYSLASEVAEYEEMLGELSGLVSEEMLEELSDSLELMRGYVGAGESSNAVDYELLEETLSFDAALLTDSNALGILNFPATALPDAITAWAEALSTLADRLSCFTYSGMNFDYSMIQSESGEELLLKTAGDAIFSALSEGFLKLIFNDTSKLSDKEISTMLLPKIDGREDGEESSDNWFTDWLGALFESGSGGYEETTEQSAFYEIVDFLKYGIESVYNEALIAMYMGDHFNCYGSEGIKGTVLSYEQEYLLCGNRNDEVNLAGTLLQLLLLRLVSTGIFTFTNKTMGEQAEAAAQALVGFTGLPFLTIAVKYLILFCWALEEAVVEVSAIVRGKKVSVITNKENFCITFTELACFSPSLVEAKATSFKETGISLSYKEYLFLLLVFKNRETLTGRALDMIQENLRYEYGNGFLLTNCIVGFDIEAEFEGASKYVNLFSSLTRDYKIGGYSVTVSRKCSYCVLK